MWPQPHAGQGQRKLARRRRNCRRRRQLRCTGACHAHHDKGETRRPRATSPPDSLPPCTPPPPLAHPRRPQCAAVGPPAEPNAPPPPTSNPKPATPLRCFPGCCVLPHLLPPSPKIGTPGALLGHQTSREGRRPLFPVGTPQRYQALAERCWAAEAAARCGAARRGGSRQAANPPGGRIGMARSLPLCYALFPPPTTHTHAYKHGGNCC